jgi:hypothetical protein
MEILTEIGKQSPILAVLVFFIWYFMRQIDKRDKRIEDLSKFILDEQKEFAQMQRDDQREMIEAISIVTKSLSEILNLLRYEKRH